MPHPTEKRFEDHIENALIAQGYQTALPTDYDKPTCQLPEVLLAFIQATQPKMYEKLEMQFGTDTAGRLCKLIHVQIGKRGIVDVLRNGIETRGCAFDLVYFSPKSNLNPEHQELYAQNQLTVVRQLRYSSKDEKSIDLAIFLNGLPIITAELKNHFTGQSIVDAEKQYQQDRKPAGEPLLQFKRCLVHFCVDDDRVSMTTKLNGDKTHFLPYNKGIDNPAVPDDYKSSYLWKEVLTPDSLMDILENFVLVAEESKKEWDEKSQQVKTIKDEVLIFPRYHQLDVIRKLRNKVKEEGAGHNYLIQHTTGAGKSYSIGWLAHTLASLYQNPSDSYRLFDTILVITDRKVLDKQLRNTLKQLEQKEGVVHPADKTAQQLKAFLEKGKSIVVSTIQKFPVISQAISQLKGRRFAVIIDEVHSSQSGETSKHLKQALSLEDQQTAFGDYEEMIQKEVESRGKQEHISFFGFTGTPKNKTLELFGRPNDLGQFLPFHSYTMQQSIQEGFTLDVLSNYTTYQRYFKVQQTRGEDQELPESRAMKQLIDYVDSHDEVIKQKVGVILKHFAEKTAKKISRQAKAMVVVRSRKHCVLFFLEMKRQMKAKKLPYSCLVAFSGTINHLEEDYTEGKLNKENGLEGSDIALGLKDPRFRILIVSNKFQTGFDEPLMHSMFVDKKLNGVQCVQTLSRLNRTKKSKTDTFVLDFVNDAEDIVNAFQPFYTTTLLRSATEPDRLYDLQRELLEFGVFTWEEVEAFCALFYQKRESDEGLQPIINKAVEKWVLLETEEQKQLFKSQSQSFCRLYAYISQIITFVEVKWEKLYVFLRFLNKKLPKGENDPIDLSNAVDLDSLRIQLVSESSLSLEAVEGVLDPIQAGEASVQTEEELGLLSEIIERLNSLHGRALTGDDRIDLDRVKERLFDNSDLQAVMQGQNTEDDKRQYFEKLLKEEFSEFYGERLEFYKKVMDGKVFPMILDGLYRGFREGR